ncbi:hypothetical protein LX97_00082 [Nonlabens dokdonensis]|uniref:Uncharacterized protein n=2 Tax=Nonlabens dokdonensis TaxID=328515 RepID=L7W953_NONDD|nr:hypothetical protein [Nonlabens dokdonensis]AGC75383.1 hypothetical protein DDD_0256 [Nonlabens dokdonensis DSW-6]PZX43083.1 hypothetical protein LX97_00082 [Nonlabens dokdonensis]
MNYQRRTFLRNIGLTAVCAPLAANLSFGNKILDLDTSSLSPSILKKLENNRYDILFEESFMLNEKCRAIPVVKKTIFSGSEKSLLVLMDDDSHFILNEKQVASYSSFLTSFNANSNHVASLGNIQLKSRNITTPAEILKGDNDKDFVFKNQHGRVITVSSKSKDAHINIA